MTDSIGVTSLNTSGGEVITVMNKQGKISIEFFEGISSVISPYISVGDNGVVHIIDTVIVKPKSPSTEGPRTKIATKSAEDPRTKIATKIAEDPTTKNGQTEDTTIVVTASTTVITEVTVSGGAGHVSSERWFVTMMGILVCLATNKK